MTASFQIRRATRADVPSVVEGVRTLLAELRGLNDVDLPPSAAAACEAAVDGRAPGAVFVACAGDGAIVGLLTLTEQLAIHLGGTYGLIQDLWVSPPYRSHGIGAALVDAAADYCVARQLRAVEVCLPSYRFATFRRTLQFYEQRGFVEIGPRMRRRVS